jgi:hypothetical protein
MKIKQRLMGISFTDYNNPNTPCVLGLFLF